MSRQHSLAAWFAELSRATAREWPTWRDSSATSVQGKKFENDSAICRTRTNTPSLLPSFPVAKSRAGSELMYFGASKQAAARRSTGWLWTRAYALAESGRCYWMRPRRGHGVLVVMLSRCGKTLSGIARIDSIQTTDTSTSRLRRNSVRVSNVTAKNAALPGHPGCIASLLAAILASYVHTG
jgi:hypothetical protein